MAHTDRDDDRWFWHDHFRFDIHTRTSKHLFVWGNCWCSDLSAARKWVHPYRYEAGKPSDWNRDQRKAERSKLREELQQARNGRIDWDDLPSGGGKRYHRPYYW